MHQYAFQQQDTTRADEFQSNADKQTANIRSITDLNFHRLLGLHRPKHVVVNDPSLVLSFHATNRRGQSEETCRRRVVQIHVAYRAALAGKQVLAGHQVPEETIALCHGTTVRFARRIVMTMGAVLFCIWMSRFIKNDCNVRFRPLTSMSREKQRGWKMNKTTLSPKLVSWPV